MKREELKLYISGLFPSFSIEDSFDLPVLIIDSKDIFSVASGLKENKALSFDILLCETAVDRITHFEMIYILSSSVYHHDLEIKVKLEKSEKPEIASVYSIWKAADLFECEILDLFGIYFNNHPNLRRIFLGDEWIGYPLRKDYKDDVNVVPL